MRISFVLPDLPRRSFTGGTLCVVEHANQLVTRGHEVTIVTLRPAEQPEYIEVKAKLPLDVPRVPTPRSADTRARVAAGVRAQLARRTAGAPKLYDLASEGLRRGIGLERCRTLLPSADLTIATHSSSVYGAALYGSGRIVQYLQHDDVLTDPPGTLAREAELADRMDHLRVANSSWLRNRLVARGHTALQATNAIDHKTFYARPADRQPGPVPVVVSYGGRGVEWKGFADAAEAMRRIRHELGEVRWLVYGDAALPPDNAIAPYEHLGGVFGDGLRELYSQADVVLCPSWYESYPLPPIEAMACGVPVVTTPEGTEDYARHDETAWIVPAKDPDAMARGMIALLRDRDLAARVASGGLEEARLNTWSRAGDVMERVLLEAVATDRDAS